MRLDDTDIRKLLPHYLAGDGYARGLCAALNPWMREIAQKIPGVLLYYNTEELPEDALDAMAHALSVTWYDFGADIETKAKTIKSAIAIHQFNGTKYALERAISDYFGDGHVEEWFEFDGEPYTFDVYTSSPSATTDRVIQFYKIIEYCKNVRSHLRQIHIQTEIGVNPTAGAALRQRTMQRIGG